MNPTRVQVMDIATGQNIFVGRPDEVWVMDSGTVNVARYIMFLGRIGRNGWLQYDKSRVLVLFWP